MNGADEIDEINEVLIASNIERVNRQIADACSRVGRHPSEVTLVAVSKTKPIAAILAAMKAGLQHFGENRVEEAQSKIPQVRMQTQSPPTWHMIGHIQSRKARTVAQLFGTVHSVDSLKLAQRLSRFAVEHKRTLPVLLEINISGEDAKYGLRAANWQENRAERDMLWQTVDAIRTLPGLNLRGLMTMAPLVENPEQARPVFTALAALGAALRNDFSIPLPELSMGMTNDFPVAIEEGATMVRIGRAIFGPRSKA